MSSSSSVTELASNYAPWRRGVSWWIVLIQGIVLAALGGYSLWKTEDAIFVILIGIGLYLALMGIWIIFQAMRGNDAGFSIFGLLAAGGGMTAGLALVLPLFLIDDVQGRTLMVAFGVAMVVVGLLALMGALLERRTGSFSWMALVRSVMYFVLGVVLIASVRLDSEQVLIWIAWIALILGILLAIYSFLLYRSQREKKEAAAAG